MYLQLHTNPSQKLNFLFSGNEFNRRFRRGFLDRYLHIAILVLCEYRKLEDCRALEIEKEMHRWIESE